MKRDFHSGKGVIHEWVNPSKAEATFVQSTKIFENHLNPVMSVFIG